MPAAVAVVDATGYLRAFERTDDAPFLTVDVAIDKAWSSASFGFPTHVCNDHVTNDPKVVPLAYWLRMVAVGGGYPILEDGTLIGGSASPVAPISRIRMSASRHSRQSGSSYRPDDRQADDPHRKWSRK